MRRRLQALVLAGVLASCSTARADDNGFSGSIGFSLVQPRLGSSTFDGSGTAYGATTPTAFHHTGNEIGVRAPAMLGGDFRLDFLARYWLIGAQFFGATSLGDASDGTNLAAASQVQASSLSALGGGLHVAAAIHLDRTATLVIGPDFGIRGFSVPITAFEPTVCTGKGGSYSCAETATSTQFYFQPRATVVFPTNPSREYGFFLAPWAGVDVYPAVSWAAGFSVGFGWNQGAR